MMQVFCARHSYVLHWWDEKSNGVTTRPRLLAVWDFTFISWSSYQCYFTLRSTPLDARFAWFALLDVVCFETGFTVPRLGLNSKSWCLSQPPECWSYRCVPL